MMPRRPQQPNATWQDNLGNALRVLGELKNNVELLEQALDVNRAALEVLTRDRLPLIWAAAQHNFGLTLLALGRRKGGASHLEQSVDVFREAFHERTRERTPLEWAVSRTPSVGLFITWGNARRTGSFTRKPGMPAAQL